MLLPHAGTWHPRSSPTGRRKRNCKIQRINGWKVKVSTLGVRTCSVRNTGHERLEGVGVEGLVQSRLVKSLICSNTVDTPRAPASPRADFVSRRYKKQPLVPRPLGHPGKRNGRRPLPAFRSAGTASTKHRQSLTVRPQASPKHLQAANHKLS